MDGNIVRLSSQFNDDEKVAKEVSHVGTWELWFLQLYRKDVVITRVISIP